MRSMLIEARSGEFMSNVVIASPAGAWQSSGTGQWIDASLRSSR